MGVRGRCEPSACRATILPEEVRPILCPLCDPNVGFTRPGRAERPGRRHPPPLTARATAAGAARLLVGLVARRPLPSCASWPRYVTAAGRSPRSGTRAATRWSRPAAGSTRTCRRSASIAAPAPSGSTSARAASRPTRSPRPPDAAQLGVLVGLWPGGHCASCVLDLLGQATLVVSPAIELPSCPILP